nr:uncharacterized protein LOC131796295 [Pocillopora verrucosa]
MAWFIVQELKVKKNETVIFLSGMDTFEKSRKMAEVLRFVCELSSDAVGIVFDHLHYIAEKEGLTNYNFTRTPADEDLSGKQCAFIKLCVDCLFCCPASNRPAVYSAFLSCVNHVVILDKKHSSIAAKTHFFNNTDSSPNYLFYSRWNTNYDDLLSIWFDLNAVVLTCSGEIEDVKKYADLRHADFFLKKSEKRIFIYLHRITDKVLHSKLLSELISAPVCPSQPPVDNLGKNEDNDIALSLTENRSDQTQQHCVSLVREVNLFVKTVEDFVLLKNLLPLVTAPRDIAIWGSVTDTLEGNSIESAIYEINFTDNLHKLELSYLDLTGKCAAFIAESLHHSPNLHELCLSRNPLHSGVSHLAENLHHVPQLTELELVEVQMGEKECAALASSLQYLNKLERLIISENALGHGIIELAKNLNSVPTLTSLDLKNTNMGEDEASALARALKDAPELRYLSLGSNPLGRVVRDLVQHLSSVPKLKSLNLDGVPMTKTELKMLFSALNGREITLYTDYHVTDLAGGEWINRLLTKAELKERRIRFRKELDDDDDGDDYRRKDMFCVHTVVPANTEK